MYIYINIYPVTVAVVVAVTVAVTVPVPVPAYVYVRDPGGALCTTMSVPRSISNPGEVGKVTLESNGDEALSDEAF
jgi:hypothetical protein